MDTPWLLSGGGPDRTVVDQYRHDVVLIVKEAINSASKHSGAADVWVTAEISEEILLVKIHDNGAGFVLPESTEQGNGLNPYAR
ncbi:MAG: Signal transduction histidine-protein kinase/phosphatase DegS [Verrucomicrobia subdivision 3 bacterium]|nr:Signal transduction histidine-protein kinase/phosphatase DegS [Limisphaerales bacterium]MCS1414232.1 Signal transduction histidine-protein kinase/phosphatase DegS [Limisphaerales bacterium]